MSKSNHNRWWLIMAAAMALAVLAASARAGEFTLGTRVGKTWLKVDGDHLSSGNSVDANLISFGFSAAYRWDNGLLIEAGMSDSEDLTLFLLQINSLQHYWLAGGWQFDLQNNWKVTPKAGFTHSDLLSSEEDLFDSEPVDRIQDVVPFVEFTLEKRLGRHFGLGLYGRNNFEHWGNSRSFGLTLSWTFD